MSHWGKDMSNIWNSVHMTLTDSQYKTWERSTQWNQYGGKKKKKDPIERVFLFFPHSQRKWFEVKWVSLSSHMEQCIHQTPFSFNTASQGDQDGFTGKFMVNMCPQVQKVKEMNIESVYMFQYPLEQISIFPAKHPIIGHWNTSDTRLKWPRVPSLTFHNCLTWNLNYPTLSWMDSAVTQ